MARTVRAQGKLRDGCKNDGTVSWHSLMGLIPHKVKRGEPKFARKEFHKRERSRSRCAVRQGMFDLVFPRHRVDPNW